MSVMAKALQARLSQTHAGQSLRETAHLYRYRWDGVKAKSQLDTRGDSFFAWNCAIIRSCPIGAFPIGRRFGHGHLVGLGNAKADCGQLGFQEALVPLHLFPQTYLHEGFVGLF